MDNLMNSLVALVGADYAPIVISVGLAFLVIKVFNKKTLTFIGMLTAKLVSAVTVKPVAYVYNSIASGIAKTRQASQQAKRSRQVAEMMQYSEMRAKEKNERLTKEAEYKAIARKLLDDLA